MELGNGVFVGVRAESRRGDVVDREGARGDGARAGVDGGDDHDDGMSDRDAWSLYIHAMESLASP